MSCLKYECVSQDWFLSSTARRVYRSSAVLSMVTFACWIFLSLVGFSNEAASLLRLLFFVGAIGAGILVIGMAFYLFRFDQSHPLKQLLWFCLMAIPFLGAALYCFAVYLRATRSRATGAVLQDGFSRTSPPA